MNKKPTKEQISQLRSALNDADEIIAQQERAMHEIIDRSDSIEQAMNEMFELHMLFVLVAATLLEEFVDE